MSSPRLDEQVMRRPTFEPGAAVVLADNQEWTLPRPKVRFVPDDSPEGFQTCLTLDDGGTFHTLMTAVDAAEDDGQFIRAELSVARHLLLSNYDLTTEQVAGLLQFGYATEADPVGAAIRDGVMGVAFGRGPKPSGPGDAQP